MARATRRRLLAGLAGVLVVAAVLALLLRSSAGEPESAARSSPAPSPSASASAAPDDAAEVAQALTALTTDPASLVADGAADEVAGRAAEAVPPGTQVAPDTSSWRPDGLGGGVMTVTLTPPGGPSTDYLAVMVQEDGAWKVLATLPVDEAPA